MADDDITWRSPLDVITASLMNHAGLSATTARQVSWQVINDLFMGGWSVVDQYGINLQIYLWLDEHGVTLDSAHAVADQGLRLKLDNAGGEA